MSKVKKCWFCGKEITNENEFEIDTQGMGPVQYWHKKCAEAQGMDKESSYNFVNSNVTSYSANNSNFNKTALEALRIFAWINLACGIIGAIYIWSVFGTVEGYYYDETNPIGVVMGFISLFQGFFGWALFSVICSIADNLIFIQNRG